MSTTLLSTSDLTHKYYNQNRGVKSNRWKRVNKFSPCPICKKPDWCCVGEKLILCMRVGSERPCQSGGWFHPLDADAKPFVATPTQPKIDVRPMLAAWRTKTKPEWLERHAAELGVTTLSILALGCVWAAEHRAWAWPMSNPAGIPIGVRLRNSKGDKWAVTGSRSGLFIPNIEFRRRVYICEGPTDTAAALSIGLCAIGRPSCQSNYYDVVSAMKRIDVQEAVIISDSDAPGLKGAEVLSKCIPFPSVTWVPPCKDLRQFVSCGGTKEIIESMLRGTVWNNPHPTPNQKI